MRIGFSGHRNALAAPAYLGRIRDHFPAGVIWVHGGAKGFDTQVHDFAIENGISTDVKKPDFDTHGMPNAFFVRNIEIVESVSTLIALWDGRTSGGTFHAIQESLKLNLPVWILPREI